MDNKLLDLYSDYLISSFSYTTATGLSELTEGAVSHDKVTRFLAKRAYTTKDLWMKVKPIVRKIETEDNVLILDDTVEEKPYTDENDIIAYHFDHTKGRNVKGINMMSLLYQTDSMTIPLSFEVIKKTEIVKDKKTGRDKRKSSITKNEIARDMIKQAQQNQIKYKYLLSDTFFSSKENMMFVKQKLKKDFIFAIKTNRLVSLSIPNQKAGKYKRVEDVVTNKDGSCVVYMKGISFPVVLTKQVFINKDGSEGILYLACSDITLNYQSITSLYQKRWSIEEYHKSIKSNTAFSKSPTKTVMTQSNHFFASIYAFFKLEILKMKIQVNHFALKAKLYVNALKSSYQLLCKMNHFCVR